MKENGLLECLLERWKNNEVFSYISFSYTSCSSEKNISLRNRGIDRLIIE